MKVTTKIELRRFACLFLTCTLVRFTLPLRAHASPGSQVQSDAASEQAPPKIPADQLDSLVAPIALYPDPLLAQVLAASTYPLEIVQLQQWLEKNKNLKDKALEEAVKKQSWDPSIQAMAALPDVVKRLAEDIQWTTDLGNAFLAQQSDVMEAVQRMRKKAQDKGALKPGEQMKVETSTVENKSVIVIQQAKPEVIYVPSYDPVVVYGAPAYPYPPIYYPPPPPSGWAIAGGMALSFGVGVAMGSMWSGGWGWGCGWGHNDVNVNINNNFNRNTNIQGGSRVTNVQGGSRVTNVQGGNRVSNLAASGTGNSWQHNPQHRGGAPYSDRATANRFGGTARGDSLSNRQASARNQMARQGGNFGSDRAGLSASDRSNMGGRGGGGAGNRAGVSDRSSGMGADRVGSRDVSRSRGGGDRSAFGSGSGGFNGSSARSSSSRGSSSFGGFRGGRSRGGGRRR